MRETIDEQLRNSFYNSPEIAAMLADKEKRVLESLQSPFMAAKDVLDYYFSRMHER